MHQLMHDAWGGIAVHVIAPTVLEQVPIAQQGEEESLCSQIASPVTPQQHQHNQ
jgi:hypothetical protein